MSCCGTRPRGGPSSAQGRESVRVVAVAAHPDDETAFAGGLLAKYASEGNEVAIV